MTLLKSLLRRARRPIDFTRGLNHKISALVEGSANESRLLNEKSNAIIEGIDNQSNMLNRKLDAVIAILNRQTRLLGAVLDAVTDDPSRLLRSHVQTNDWPDEQPETSIASFKTAQASSANLPSSPPLLVAEKTYNTSHPDYDATLVRNFPANSQCNSTLQQSRVRRVDEAGNRRRRSRRSVDKVLRDAWMRPKQCPIQILFYNVAISSNST